MTRTADGWKLQERKLHLLGADGWHNDYRAAAHTCPAIAATNGQPQGSPSATVHEAIGG